MVGDSSLGLDGAKQQHRHIGVHEEDQHEQRAHIVESWQGDDEGCQQCLQALQAMQHNSFAFKPPFKACMHQHLLLVIKRCLGLFGC